MTASRLHHALPTKEPIPSSSSPEKERLTRRISFKNLKYFYTDPNSTHLSAIAGKYKFLIHGDTRRHR
jgi:hypothetical protein